MVALLVLAYPPIPTALPFLLRPSLFPPPSVAVVLHEIARLGSSPPAATEAVSPLLGDAEDPAGPKALEACLHDAEALLLEVGFLLEHTARARMAKVRGLLQRGLVQADEVALLRGMVRQLRWAVRRDRP